MDPIVKDIINTYDDDFSLVQRLYHQFSSGDAYIRMQMERPIIARSTQRQIYETEIERCLRRSASVVNDEQVSWIFL